MTERDYISRTIETIRNHRDSENVWPQWANILADEVERLRIELRDAWVREIYTEEGARIWIQDAEGKKQSIIEQLARLDQLRTGAFA